MLSNQAKITDFRMDDVISAHGASARRGRIQSVPGKSTFPFSSSPIMHPTDQMSTGREGSGLIVQLRFPFSAITEPLASHRSGCSASSSA